MAQLLPHTTQSLCSDLRALGVTSGDVVLLHSSMRSLGFAVGGTQAIVHALLEAVGPGGTVVVPTHTSDNCDPVDWHNPPVPEQWWPVIRDEAPGFDKDRTPSRWMGAIAETVRTWPGALRSDHPRPSFAAVGVHAADITGVHPLDDVLGDRSPLGAVHRYDGKVLLLGCGHDSNTSLHLAEWRQESPPRGINGSSIRQADGTGRWTTWTDVMEDEADFERLGAAFEATVGLSTGPVGNATARLMSQRVPVDFATTWLAANRPSVVT
ncbi:MAG: AAC(3) family N-acetyltransferase [Pseudonocardiales bacterium]|nr:MAG: AAC(3) family N-acetyltransferase [Pseudonocardiales bacterium]